jgi:hypothetical protein
VEADRNNVQNWAIFLFLQVNPEHFPPPEPAEKGVGKFNMPSADWKACGKLNRCTTRSEKYHLTVEQVGRTAHRPNL